MIEIFESVFKVVHGGQVLLDYGDALAGPGISINGSHVIKPAHFVRALGLTHFAKGGEGNTLEFTLMEPSASMADAVKSGLNHILNAPRDVAPLYVQLESGETWKFNSAAVESWSADSSEAEGVIAARTYSVIAGAIESHPDGDLEVFEIDDVDYFVLVD